MTTVGALVLSVLTAFTAPAVPSPSDVVWTADDTQSNVTLSISELLFAKIGGMIPIQSATIVTTDGGVPLEVDATLDAALLDTHNPGRDAQLRSQKFFNVARFPTIGFASERVTATGPQSFAIDGELSMRGVTHPLHLDGAVTGVRRDADGRERARYEATGRFRRSDYGITYANVVVSDEVALDIVIEASAPPPASTSAPAAVR